MALNLKSGLSFGCLGVKELGFRPPRSSSSACLAVVRSVDDESTSNSAAELRKVAHQTDSKLAKNLNRDFNSLPSGFLCLCYLIGTFLDMKFLNCVTCSEKQGRLGSV